MDGSRDCTSSVQEFKLFGATIAMEATHAKDSDAEGGEEPSDPKRPNKALPCPRCKSTETKFCYFNNYNVNQPRHFCKGCQRYWTAGGTLRNVPFGAGRRKARPPCHRPMALTGNYIFNPSELKELGLEGVLEQWQFSTATSSKRRNGGSSGHTR